MGDPVVDDNFSIIFIAFQRDLGYKLPAEAYGNKWEKILDTAGLPHDRLNTLHHPPLMFVVAR